MSQGTFDRKWLVRLVLFSSFLLAVFVAAYLRLIPTRLAYLPFYDTLGHFVLYGILAALLHLGIRSRAMRLPYLTREIPVAIIVTIALAVLDEALQSLSPYRSADLIDLTSDVIGIVLFVTVLNWVAKKERESH